MPLLQEIEQIQKNAECLYSLTEIEYCLEKLGAQISQTLANKNPVVITVMNGGLVFSGRLLPYLKFPLELDYVHATRYRGDLVGNTLTWLAKPQLDLNGRTVLLVDDIFDQGFTLKAVIDECFNMGAAKVLSAVLLKKNLNKASNLNLQADYIGFEIPDRYVFGFGMDYKNYLRNAPGIFAVSD